MEIKPDRVNAAEGVAVLGVLARVDVRHCGRVVEALEGLDGVSTFSVEELERVGILIEAASLDEAHAMLIRDVESAEGVLGAWPVFAHAEGDTDPLEGADDGKDAP